MCTQVCLILEGYGKKAKGMPIKRVAYLNKTMKQEILAYPVILTEYNDEDGHYYVVTSPNIQGMVTDGETITEALYHAKDAIATMLDAPNYPKIQDPKDWKLEKNQQVSWVTVNMTN